MSVVFVAVVWCVLGAVVCFLSGRGSADRRVPTRLLLTTPLIARRFVAQSSATWALEADRAALEQLLTDASDAPVPAAPRG